MQPTSRLTNQNLHSISYQAPHLPVPDVPQWQRNIPFNSRAVYPPNAPSIAPSLAESRASTLFEIQSSVGKDVFNEICSIDSKDVVKRLRKLGKHNVIRHILDRYTEEDFDALFANRQLVKSAQLQIDKLIECGKGSIMYYQSFSTAFCALREVAGLVCAGYVRPANAIDIAGNDVKQKIVKGTAVLSQTVQIVEPIVTTLINLLSTAADVAGPFAAPAKGLGKGIDWWSQDRLKVRLARILNLVPRGKEVTFADSLARSLAIELKPQLNVLMEEKETGLAAKAIGMFQKVAGNTIGTDGLECDVKDPSLDKVARQAVDDVFALINWIFDHKDTATMNQFFQKAGQLKQIDTDALLHTLASGVLAQYQDKTRYCVEDTVEGVIPYISTADVMENRDAMKNTEALSRVSTDLHRNRGNDRLSRRISSSQPDSIASFKIVRREDLRYAKLDERQSIDLLGEIVAKYKGGVRAVPNEPNRFISKAGLLKTGKKMLLGHQFIKSASSTPSHIDTIASQRLYALSDFQKFFEDHRFNPNVLTEDVYVKAMDKIVNGKQRMLQKACADKMKYQRETTRSKIEYLYSTCRTTDEFTAGMRSILRHAPDVGIRLQDLSEDCGVLALEVLAEQTELRSLELELNAPSYRGGPDY